VLVDDDVRQRQILDVEVIQRHNHAATQIEHDVAVHFVRRREYGLGRLEAEIGEVELVFGGELRSCPAGWRA
jgi:hypothetical protein